MKFNIFEPLEAKSFLSLIKFSHTVFALPFAILGFVIASLLPSFDFSIKTFVLILICMLSARNSAMTFNRIVDSKYDKMNPRTQSREIPAGIIKLNQAKIFLAINMLVFVCATYFINRLCFLLSPVSLIVLLGYSYTKRFTFLSHFILGLALALAPIGAYIAVANAMSYSLIYLSLGILTWVASFDILYALQDEEFDKQHKLRSIPAFFGSKFSIAISMLSLVISMLSFFMYGYMTNVENLYYWGLGIFAILNIFQFVVVFIKNISSFNSIFVLSNGIGSIIFCCLAIIDLLISNG